MDPILLYDMLDDNRDWEFVVLPDNRGIVIGNYDLVATLLDSINLSERHINE